MLNYVNNNGPLEEGRARRYFCQLISALHYLHNVRFIAHRDLKAENVLLDRNDNIRLIDFGLSRAFTKGTPTLLTACGSPAYEAPEMIKGFSYTKAADMWSAGVLLYAIVAGRLPFDSENRQDLLQKIVTEEPRYPSIMSRCLIDLLKRLLVKDPNGRITIDRIQEHPWFSQCQYSLLIGFNTTVIYGDGVDRDVIDCMSRMGIDCCGLYEQVLRGVFTRETAVYRELRRYKVADRISNFLKGMQKFDRHAGRPVNARQDALIPLPRRVGDPLRVFQSHSPQAQVASATRRNSRPIVLRMPVEAGEQRLPSFETP
jgi:hypothetical protein